MPFLIIWLLFGVGAAIVASNKGRSGFGWFLLGVILGPFGLIFALLVSKLGPPLASDSHLPPGWRRRAPQVAEPLLDPDTKTCPRCAETIKLAATKCRFCGELLDNP